MKNKEVKSRKEWLINFNDIDGTINNLSELGVSVSNKTKSNIETSIKSARTTASVMPIYMCADIYYRVANDIIRRVELDVDIKFEKYTKQNYEA